MLPSFRGVPLARHSCTGRLLIPTAHALSNSRRQRSKSSSSNQTVGAFQTEAGALDRLTATTHTQYRLPEGWKQVGPLNEGPGLLLQSLIGAL
jgi:hypothetical protein